MLSVISLMTIAASVPAMAAGGGKFRSSEDALNQGLSAYNGGFFEIAVPAFQAAAKAGNENDAFLARYYLARIFADNGGARTDHGRAYELYHDIADAYADMDDPEDNWRAPFVAKSLVALAGYARLGIADIGLSADTQRAAGYLHTAAVVFNDEDAQFELAKLQLKGEGVEVDEEQAKHWLSTLSQKGHAGAQAFLADLYWRGLHMEKDRVRALALISVAVGNAPPNERVWIEDIYQNIYCGVGEDVRKEATGLVAGWSTRYGRKPDVRSRDGLGPLNPEAVRTCQDGKPLPALNASTHHQPPVAGGGNLAEVRAATPAGRVIPPAAAQGFVQGSATPSLRDVGAGFIAPAGH